MNMRSIELSKYKKKTRKNQMPLINDLSKSKFELFIDISFLQTQW